MPPASFSPLARPVAGCGFPRMAATIGRCPTRVCHRSLSSMSRRLEAFTLAGSSDEHHLTPYGGKTMLVQPYLFLDGRCEEALDFYRKTLGAQVEMMMRFKESPD